jgi:hypothetical protein
MVVVLMEEDVDVAVFAFEVAVVAVVMEVADVTPVLAFVSGSHQTHSAFTESPSAPT